MSSYNFTSVNGDGEDGSGEMLLNGLAKYTRYTLVVQAFNEIGVGPLSEPVSAQTMEDGESLYSLKVPVNIHKMKKQLTILFK